MNKGMNNSDYQYDTTCRLSAEDKEMMTRVSSCNRLSSTVRQIATTVLRWELRSTVMTNSLFFVHIDPFLFQNTNLPLSCVFHSDYDIHRILPSKTTDPARRKRVSRLHQKTLLSWRKRNWSRFTCQRRSNFKTSVSQYIFSILFITFLWIYFRIEKHDHRLWMFPALRWKSINSYKRRGDGHGTQRGKCLSLDDGIYATLVAPSLWPVIARVSLNWFRVHCSIAVKSLNVK